MVRNVFGLNQICNNCVKVALGTDGNLILGVLRESRELTVSDQRTFKGEFEQRPVFYSDKIHEIKKKRGREAAEGQYRIDRKTWQRNRQDYSFYEQSKSKLRRKGKRKRKRKGKRKRKKKRQMRVRVDTKLGLLPRLNDLGRNSTPPSKRDLRLSPNIVNE